MGNSAMLSERDKSSFEAGDQASFEAGDQASFEAEFARLRDDVTSLMETVKDLAAKEAHSVAETVRHGIDGAAERVRSGSKRVKDSAQDAAASLQANVEEHPIPSVLLALGLGVVVGMLLRR